jgi:hypothetical protein
LAVEATPWKNIRWAEGCQWVKIIHDGERRTAYVIKGGVHFEADDMRDLI